MATQEAIDWSAVDAKIAELKRETDEPFISVNDPRLAYLVPHWVDPRQDLAIPPEASTKVSGTRNLRPADQRNLQSLRDAGRE